MKITPKNYFEEINPSTLPEVLQRGHSLVERSTDGGKNWDTGSPTIDNVIKLHIEKVNEFLATQPSSTPSASDNMPKPKYKAGQTIMYKGEEHQIREVEMHWEKELVPNKGLVNELIIQYITNSGYRINEKWMQDQDSAIVVEQPNKSVFKKGQSVYIHVLADQSEKNRFGNGKLTIESVRYSPSGWAYTFVGKAGVIGEDSLTAKNPRAERPAKQAATTKKGITAQMKNRSKAAVKSLKAHQSKFKAGSFVKYTQGFNPTEIWYGEVVKVVDLGNEFAYRLDSFNFNYKHMDKASANEKYEPQLIQISEKEYNSLYHDWQRKYNKEVLPKVKKLADEAGEGRSQYVSAYEKIRAKYNAIVFLKVGTFYEIFGKDAIVVSKTLGIILTSFQHDGKKMECTGFPEHNLDTYLAKMVRAGHRVAVSESINKDFEFEPDNVPAIKKNLKAKSSAAVKNLKAKEKRIVDIGYGNMGTEYTVAWDRNVTENHDYKTIAHINTITGEVNLIDKDLPKEAIAELHKAAKVFKIKTTKPTAETKKAAAKPTPKKPTPKKKMDAVHTNRVEKVSDSVTAIRSFAALHGKMANRLKLQSVLKKIQNALLEKRIRNTDKSAAEIYHVQEILVKGINKMCTEAIEINVANIDKFRKIADSETRMRIIPLLKRYVAFQSKDVTSDDALELKAKLEKWAGDHEPSENKYKPHAQAAIVNLKKFAGGEFNIDQYELHGLAGIGCSCDLSGSSKENELCNIVYKVKFSIHGQNKTAEIRTYGGMESVKSMLKYGYGIPSNKFEVVKKTTVNNYLKTGVHLVSDDLKKGLGSADNDGIFSSMDSVEGAETFSLPGQMGNFFGELEQHELAIAIEGEQGAGKTPFILQIGNAFAEAGKKVGFISLEIAKNSKVMQDYINWNVAPQNKGKIQVAGEAPNGIAALERYAKAFDVIMVDSWTQIENVKQTDVEYLRKKYPNTIWIFIFQRTSSGEIRGGNKPKFDAPINIELTKPAYDFKQNYAQLTKSRYGNVGAIWNIAGKKVITKSQLDDMLN